MQLAHIVPFKNRELVREQSLHLWVANAPGDWLHFYKELPEASQVILDNGAFEGEMVPFDKLLDIARICPSVKEIVLPDVFRSAEKTRERYYSEAVPHKQHAGLSGCSFMYVAHGPTGDQFESTLQHVLRDDPIPIGTVGLSYKPTVETYTITYDYLPRSWIRAQVVQRLVHHKVIGSHPLHCLGLWDPAELLSLAQAGRIRSCDTSLAACATHIRLEFQDKHLYPSYWEDYAQRIPRPANFFSFEGLDEGLLLHNIQFLNHIAEQAHSYYGQ